MNPAVSIIIPAYNAAPFIFEALTSVARQDYPDLEIVVVDDGSQDDTAEIVRRNFPQARLIAQKNAGVAAARNTGLDHATGDLIAFLDADDGWSPWKLSAQVAYLSAHPDVGAVYHRWHVRAADATGRYAPIAWERPTDPTQIDVEASGWIYPQLLLDCIMHTSTVMMRRDVARAVGHFDTTLPTGEDYDYWLRLSRECEIHKLAGVYSFYRQVASSLTGSPKARNNEYVVVLNAVRRWGLAAPDGTLASRQDVRRRLARLAFDFGYVHFYRGSAAIAGNAFADSLRHEPFRWRSAAYLVASRLRALVN